MNIINNVINRLNFLINEVPVRLNKFSAEELSLKPSPGKWSKKEIMGHLCDSAVNNLSRFVRAQHEDQPFTVTRYRQDDWVKENHYNDMTISGIIDFWKALNIQIIWIITRISGDKLGIVCDLGEASFREGEFEKTLLWLIEDYLVHMEYHLKQIVGEI